MDAEITKCAELLKEGKVILYPTDTIWGLGCDATNPKAVDKIYKIKERQEIKSLIILIDSESRLPLYVEDIPLIAWDLITHTYRPTTYIYPKAKNLPSRLIPMDQSIAIRIVKNKFCQKLIQALDKPIISTSANLSGEPSPASFKDISAHIINKVDYVVPEKFAEGSTLNPSRLIKFIDDYNFVVIRE
ncbi:MAG TPA: L-threonylcarbamoyladenylate synthase [Bacteroidales bacterium]|nr:L-threonylcarbamoyladenylate synthase [Bacteroidales bacterium]HOH22036.1 L-threonylcarbamoyladenylate synthase [Bacteroidales bacterium]HPZ03319.1 L-threonylcarbamoyladenylate synthase [Bacteroidales bacterium]HQB75102.1 L-threonylcarbamoyladenylate synthase [Bacteroidales bacterium]